ncbi:unnamed protein product [Spirodela intermedia]|uniref:DOMON domain-containing protein n=1 Tax=Spirodela intermedia TaxID=51605 RepID=A0A7I8ITM6_SPIIN|nr:unnamed protein product [Spirodela intermedia]CAA6660314.1 unnamed protein product [Spirodela intermedia]
MRVSFVAIFFCGLLLGSSSVNGDDDDNGGSSPLSPSSSVPCSLPLDVSSKLLPFNTSSLICSSVWSSQGFTLMYKQSGPSLWSFVLTAPDNNVYIAIGFSSKGRMIGSDAVAGWVPSSGAGVVKRYTLGGYSSGECPPDQGNLRLSSRLYLAFQLNTSQPESNLIYAIGPAASSRRRTPPAGSRGLHEHQPQLRHCSSVVASSNLQRFHGVAGMLGWGVLLLIGVAIARFCKRWDPFWFYGHLSLQLSGLEDKVGVDVDVHKSLGVLILVLGCLQVTALLARPDKGSKMRRYWNWFHHYVGRAAIAFAIGNIFYGFSLSNEAVSWSIGYGAFLGILLVVCLVLEVCAILRNRESSHSV